MHPMLWYLHVTGSRGQVREWLSWLERNIKAKHLEQVTVTFGQIFKWVVVRSS